eukprot:Pgem_evm1s776
MTSTITTLLLTALFSGLTLHTTKSLSVSSSKTNAETLPFFENDEDLVNFLNNKAETQASLLKTIKKADADKNRRRTITSRGFGIDITLKPIQCSNLPGDGLFRGEADSFWNFNVNKGEKQHNSRRIDGKKNPVWNTETDVYKARIVSLVGKTKKSITIDTKVIDDDGTVIYDFEDDVMTSGSHTFDINLVKGETVATQTITLGYGCKYEVGISVDDIQSNIQCSLTQLTTIAYDLMKKSTAPGTMVANECGQFKVHDKIRVDTQEINAVIHEVSKTIILSWRGSESSISDWMNNFNFLPSQCDAFDSIHTGFCSEYLDTKDFAQTALTAYPGYKSVFAGHSQGGAIATIAAANFQKAGQKVGALITWGQPAACNNKALNDFLHQTINVRARYVTLYKNIFSIVQQDFFALLPPFFGWQHWDPDNYKVIDLRDQGTFRIGDGHMQYADNLRQLVED